MNARVVPLACLFALGVLQGCVATRPPLEIDVTDDGFAVGGQVFRTQGELTNAIRASGATACRVVPDPTTAYEQVRTAMGSLRDAGCRPGIVGHVAP